MDPNEQRCRDIVAAYRRGGGMPPDVRAAAWARLREAIDAGDAPAVEATGKDRRRDVAWAAVLVAAAALVVLFSARGRLTGREGEGDAGSQAAHGAAATTEVLAPASGGRGGPASPPEEAPVEEAAPAPEVRRPRAPGRAVGVPGDRSDLDAELALLRGAREALGRGAPAEALERLAEHERAFAGGYLQEERMLLRARAECELGRGEAARATAAALVRTFPDSPHARTAAGVCASGADATGP